MIGARCTHRITASEDLVESRERPSIRRPGQGGAPHLEIANTVEPVQGKIFIELINYPMLFKDKASPAEYWAGLQHTIAKGWLVLHESGTFVMFTDAGADMFA